MRYSPSTGGFYAEDITYPALPTDLIEISDAEHADLLAGQETGQVIVPGASGAPVLADRPPPTPKQAYAILQFQARQALQESDQTILRCYENAVTVPATWAAYRASLRGIVSGAYSASSPTALPTKPAYPAGT